MAMIDEINLQFADRSGFHSAISYSTQVNDCAVECSCGLRFSGVDQLNVFCAWTEHRAARGARVSYSLDVTTWEDFESRVILIGADRG